jgi:hypothetical protein
MGLIMRPVSVVRVAQALDQNPDPGDSLDTMRDLGRWQLDWVFVSAQHKGLALVDLCRSADDLPDQLTAAGARKQRKYSPLVEALSHYSDNGWVVHTFPWVVGVRGLIDPRHINALLEFLAIHKRHWQTAAEKTVLASVRALYFMHRVRFGGSQGRQLAGQMWCSLDSSGEDDDDLDELVAQATRKRKPVTASVRSGSGSPPDTVRAAPSKDQKLQRTHLGTRLHPRTPNLIMYRKAQCLPTGGGARRASSLRTSGHTRRRHHGQRNTKGSSAVRAVQYVNTEV